MIGLPIQAYCTDQHIDLLKILRTSSLGYRKLFRRVAKKHFLWKKIHLRSWFFNFLGVKYKESLENCYSQEEPRET